MKTDRNIKAIPADVREKIDETLKAMTRTAEAEGLRLVRTDPLTVQWEGWVFVLGVTEDGYLEVAEFVAPEVPSLTVRLLVYTANAALVRDACTAAGFRRGAEEALALAVRTPPWTLGDLWGVGDAILRRLTFELASRGVLFSLEKPRS